MTAFGPAAPDERELLRSLQQGSLEALGVLYERTAPYLYALACRIVGTRERACAVIEDLFEEIWRDRAQWGAAGEIPHVAWITRCRDLALDQVGPEAARDPSDRTPCDRTPCGSVTANGSIRDAHAIAREALATLPEKDRLALEEAYYHGTGASEVAARIGATTTAAATLLRSALVRLRDHALELQADPSELLEAS